MVVACFDIGGTGIKAALIGSDKQINHRQEWATPASLAELLALMDSVIQPVDGLEAISLSIPGAVDLETGVIQGLSAVPYIHGVSWYELLSQYGCPVYLENDANCVGLSELAVDDQLSTFACVVCGTGIGGALIVDRKLIRGKQGFGGEFGYMLIATGKEPLKNWSQLASTGSLVRQVASQYEEAVEDWNGKRIFELAEQGDEVCQLAIEEMTRNLAYGILNISYFLEPEVLAIGGSISQNPVFIQAIQEQLEAIQREYPEEFPYLPAIRACHYQQDANLMGAYMKTLQ
ncbi:ROK family protein [Streptococcus suis]|uniref:ROK family protein n=1 Tax=Streptococcus suis TaxID=1307 RepID=UPI000D668A04|nr:ROK family protein [Streptococcus suis]AWL26698.1 ROK family protein [Streptococcus suis]